MGWGDEIVAAGQAQRLYDEDPSTRIAIRGAEGVARWHPIWDGNPILATPDEVRRGESVRWVTNGPNARPYIQYPFTKQSGWTFSKTFRCRDHIARLHLTPAELARGWDVRADVGPYVLIEPFTKHENFRWSLTRWTSLVAQCPDLTFVQHTHAESFLPIPGARHVAASFREACGLIAASRCYVRSESGLCHAAAALGIPQVTLFGGCMDAEVMGDYPGQTCVVDHAEGSPCGSWELCAHCTAAMDRISVEMVIAALRARLTAGPEPIDVGMVPPLGTVPEPEPE